MPYPSTALREYVLRSEVVALVTALIASGGGGGGGGAPSGAASGALSGTYPSPGLANGAATGAVLGADVLTTGSAQIKTGILTAPVWDSGGHVFNVKAYGPVDTPTNTVATIAAAAAAANAVGGGTIQFPAGTFTINAQLGAPGNNLHFRGAGPAATTIILAAASNCYGFNFGNRTDISVSDMTLNGNLANQTSGSCNGIGVDSGITRLTVRNVTFLNWRTRGVSIAGTCADVRVEDCTFDGASTHLALAQMRTTFVRCVFRNGPGTSVMIGDDCQIINCRFEAASSTQRVAIGTGVSTSNGNNALIQGNTFSWAAAGNAATDADCAISTHSAANRVRILDNYLLCGTHVGGIYLGGLGTPLAVSASNCVIQGNQVIDACGDAILVGGTEPTPGANTGVANVVTGNTVLHATAGIGGAQGGGIEVQLERTSVTGNTVSGCDNAGVYLGGPNCTATGNTVKGCAQAAVGGGIKITKSGCVAVGNISLDHGNATYGGFGVIVIPDSIGSSIANVMIRNNRCSDTRAGGARSQQYGVFVSDFAGLTVGNVNIAGNDCTNNVIATLNVSAATGGNILHRDNGVDESTTAPVIVNGQTILTAGLMTARVAPAGPVTGSVLSPGSFGGQQVVVLNESTTASSITFAAAGTSHVANGTACSIAGLNCRVFLWDSVTALWYPNGAPASGGGGAGLYDSALFDAATYS